MEDKEFKQLFDQNIKEYAQRNQYGVSMIPFHVHNGVDSPLIDSSNIYGISKVLFDHYVDAGNTGTGEDTLYTDTLVRGQLSRNGEKIEAEYGGVFVSSATATRQIKIYFGGTAIFDSGALTLSLSATWTIYVTIIKVSNTVVRSMVSLATQGAALSAYTAYTEITGLNLSNTQILKITGEAAGVGAATNDIVAKLGTVIWYPTA